MLRRRATNFLAEHVLRTSATEMIWDTILDHDDRGTALTTVGALEKAIRVTQLPLSSKILAQQLAAWDREYLADARRRRLT